MDFQRITTTNNNFEESNKSLKECINTLYEDSKLKYFFDVFIPAAKARKETMGHVLFVCSDNETERCFVSLLKDRKNDVNIKAVSFPPDLKPGELSAILTNLQCDDIILIENNTLYLEQECIDVLKTAMSKFYIDIIVGKGANARSIRIDLPHFTLVMCVEENSKSLSSLLKQFDYIIKVDEENLPKLCKAKIKAECPFQITDETCEYISYKAKHDVHTSINYLKRVIEYLEYKKIETTITKSIVEEIFDLTGIGETIEQTIDDDEIFSLFRDIRNSLRDIQDDVHVMRESIEELVAAHNDDF